MGSNNLLTSQHRKRVRLGAFMMEFNKINNVKSYRSMHVSFSNPVLIVADIEGLHVCSSFCSLCS